MQPRPLMQTVIVNGYEVMTQHSKEPFCHDRDQRLNGIAERHQYCQNMDKVRLR